MELREPPQKSVNSSSSPNSRGLRGLQILCLVMLGLLLVRSFSGIDKNTIPDGDRVREVAGKLRAAGALNEAAKLYETLLTDPSMKPQTMAKIAYSLGSLYLAEGQIERALRWFYESENLGPGALANDVAAKIVHCLERMGRVHLAQAALDARIKLDTSTAKRSEEDPVVASVGNREIHASEVHRALESLPPHLAQQFSGSQGRNAFLKKFVADELLWRKAKKLQYDRDPEVTRRLEAAGKQLAVGLFLEREVASKITIKEPDLKTYFEANKTRYDQKGQGVSFEKVKDQVASDYRIWKLQTAYQELVEEQLKAADVQLFSEAWEQKT